MLPTLWFYTATKLPLPSVFIMLIFFFLLISEKYFMFHQILIQYPSDGHICDMYNFSMPCKVARSEDFEWSHHKKVINV
jgi:hypothetical protein